MGNLIKNKINKFELGEIVTFKTHPLLYNLRIKGDDKFVPPLMIVKEIFFENKKKKIVEESFGKIISDYIKYTCVYFDDNKSEFKEVVIYETMLDSYKNIFIERLDKKKGDNKKSLQKEVLGYKKIDYNYGAIIYFKTKKIEAYKKRNSKKSFYNQKSEKVEMKDTVQYLQSFISPDFVICGYKKEAPENLFYPNGKKRRIVSIELIKVKWFNPLLLKFSEKYVPIECFTDINPFGVK